MAASPGDVNVWYRFTDTIQSRSLKDDVALLDPIESARCRRFLFAADRRDYAAAHALLRRTLSRYRPVPPAAWRFEESPSGKPVIVGGAGIHPPLAFSLSHARGLVACAVADAADVGVDVERVERAVDVDDLASHYFSPGEARDLAATPRSQRGARFTELWSLKEAYVKGIGLGLSHPLHSFGFECSSGTLQFTTTDPREQSGWQFALFALGRDSRYRLAVAVRDRGRTIPRQIRAHDADSPDVTAAGLLAASFPPA